MIDLGSEAAFDEAGELKALQRDAKAFLKRLEALTNGKPGDAGAIDALDTALGSLPTSDEAVAALNELRARARELVARARERRAESCRIVEANFIRMRREAGDSVREAGEGAWRIGSVELQLQRDRARARVLYNREPLTSWSPIGQAQDLEKLVAASRERLAHAALNEEELIAVFWEAYEYLRLHSKSASATAVRIPLPEFYREVRVAWARHELRQGKPDRKLSRPEFPLWAFLYNLDRYRKALPTISGERKLALETGSQRDQQSGMAMIVNGLDAKDDYRSYCYVFSSAS